jgi:hypothetical protein
MATRGPKPKTHCVNGHELVEGNIRQLYNKNGGKDGRRCLKCSATRISRYRELYPEKANESRTNSAIKMKFGLNGIVGREELLAAQGNKCAACDATDCTWGKGFKNKWHIDHDHKTGKVRGILCSRCNLTLGQVQDYVEYMRKLSAYLNGN